MIYTLLAHYCSLWWIFYCFIADACLLADFAGYISLLLAYIMFSRPARNKRLAAQVVIDVITRITALLLCVTVSSSFSAVVPVSQLMLINVVPVAVVVVVVVVVVFFYWPSLSVLAVSKLSLANGCTSWWRLNKFLSARRISLLRPKFIKGFNSELSNRKKPEKGKVACTFTFWAKA